MINEKICVLGLGYVGLPLAVEFGKRVSTLGFDVSESRVLQLQQGFDRTLEVSSEALASSSLLSLTHREADLVGCSVFIVTVPTPIDEDKKPDLRYLINACKIIGKLIQGNALVVFESTVYPGCTEEVCVPILEDVSGMTLNVDFFCGYSPERINPGDKENTLTKVTKIVSGSNSAALERVDEIYSMIIEAGTYRAESMKVAEAAKVIENTQRDVNIALVNEFALIFEKLGIDTAEVLNAAGTKWNFQKFSPGLVGGHCIGVDPYYLIHRAEQAGVVPQMIKAGRTVNDHMAIHAARKFVGHFNQQFESREAPLVGVLGVTFKDNCPDVRNSKVFDLIDEIIKLGFKVLASDPWADAEQVKDEYGIIIDEIDSLKNLDGVIIAVAHEAYVKMSAEELTAMLSPAGNLVLDLKGVLDREEMLSAGLNVIRI